MSETRIVNCEKKGPAPNRLGSPPLAPLARIGSLLLQSPPGDILERSLRELVRYYRHSATGRRCHGIIHNLNAPLQVLSFQLDLLEQKAEAEQEYLDDLPVQSAEKLLILLNQRRQKLQQMKQEIDNLHTITRRLIQQGLHEDWEDRLHLDLNGLYQDELALYEDNLFFKHQVHKEFTFEANLPPVYGHYIDFSQSFRNLVDNALEAMENVTVRRLTVETRLEAKRRFLRIGDTGGGIPAGVGNRIFEPFFTTKGTAEQPRAGLGLFMARHLLAPYGGHIQVESSAGETWVTMILPVT